MTRCQVLREIISLKAIIQPTAIRCLYLFERCLSQRYCRFSHGCGLEPLLTAVVEGLCAMHIAALRADL